MRSHRLLPVTLYLGIITPNFQMRRLRLRGPDTPSLAAGKSDSAGAGLSPLAALTKQVGLLRVNTAKCGLFQALMCGT